MLLEVILIFGTGGDGGRGVFFSYSLMFFSRSEIVMHIYLEFVLQYLQVIL